MDLIYITPEVNDVYLIYVPKDKASNNIETHQCVYVLGVSILHVFLRFFD
jgi:hypothetical protein